MNPILVAVDFSNTSIRAIEYAIPLANKLKSSIQMIWVDKISPQESLYPDTSNQNRNEAKKRFEELINIYHKKLAKGITLEYKLKKGKIYREVDNLARLTQAELIVTGAHGISGFEEFWIGSNAFKIVTYASFPVITVRHDLLIKKTIDKILVPIDGSAETIQKLPFVVKLARLFKSEVHVVTTHNSHLKSIQRIAEKYAQTATGYLQMHSVKHISDTIIANDLTKAVLMYATNVQADLIAIMTEQETPVNILLGPQVQQLINQSPVPVLSIHPREHFYL
ncbi:MAG: universal stress protein [Bacteroidales bacterium]|jgi:nucleotide-binding universal stress UspA family protein|nr:universal stress protein [Bacteroidales bacterium]